MCSSKSKPQGSNSHEINPTLSHINGRPVLQPNCNRSPLIERRNSLKKTSTNSSSTPLQPLSSTAPAAAGTTITTTTGSTSPRIRASVTTTPPASPKLKSPRQPATKRGSDTSGLNSSVEKVVTPRSTAKSLATSVKKSKKSSIGSAAGNASNSAENSSSSSLKYSSSLIVEAPGSIAAARREQVAIMQVQRKMRIAHYGRTKSAKYEGKVIPLDSSAITSTTTVKEEKRCNFITSNSDPIYIAYHDEEWGVPVHDDKLLFELLVLTGAQVGSDWTTVLKKRQDFRDAFSGFDAEIVAKSTEKKMTSICTDYGIELSQVRGAVDNANRILEIKKEFGSFDKYLWAFVNQKPIATQYKSCLKISVKTSKSESISKAMVRRGFRYVGPTVIHSFMQGAGLTNDHLITCPRHLQCLALASRGPAVAPAL